MDEPNISISSGLLENIELAVNIIGIETELKKELNHFKDEKCVPFRVVKRLHEFLSASGTNIYLHELIQGCDVCLPTVELASRDPELEARCKRLRAQQENREYKKMVREVDKKDRDYFAPGKDLKEMNRQMVSVFNFIVTVGGAFAFGYKGVEYSFHGDTFAFQLIVGLSLATVVFFADLYFLLKENS
ncbi:transmembrane protein 199-like isoform X2 [Dreissena polymorpha]|uniref:Transmembrane protein 199 n=1 Tax=Dreissena polymorpha TaxID=45954 RepID=A0A9D4S4R9_DREPO|nr:transmembrane protein 199-like isoform X2 [Dreissena polymorpha]XP_052247712.1 transmembrane protein 199-like isoform X2 [Dreissena polymorpha]KAH3891588.1 hypothetical protein DPMN_015692 [Dreissena polymorpha]KAH3891661.1 hypothetical protein DPMN_015766 [Dreissena polymorpha]